METPEIDSKLQIGIGDKEIKKLEPSMVIIEKVKIVPVGEKKILKVVCSVKHPEKDELVEISAVKHELTKDKLKIVGLWFKTDEEDKLQKGTPLAKFISFVGADNILALIKKEVETTLDENNYIVFKAY